MQAGFRGFVKKWVPRGSPLGVGIQGTVVHQEGVLMVKQGLHHRVQDHHHGVLKWGIRSQVVGSSEGEGTRDH